MPTKMAMTEKTEKPKTMAVPKRMMLPVVATTTPTLVMMTMMVAVMVTTVTIANWATQEWLDWT